MNYERITRFTKELRRRLDHLESLEKTHADELQRVERDSLALVNARTKDVEEKIGSYLLEELSSITGLLDPIRRLLQKHGYAASMDAKAYVHVPISENAAKLEDIFADIQELCRKLNALDFDKIDPAIQYSVDTKTCKVVATQNGQSVSIENVNGKNRAESHYSGILKQLASKVKEAEERAAGIEAARRMELLSYDYTGACTRQRNSYLQDYKESSSAMLRREIERLLIKEDGEINEAFFKDLLRIGEESLPDRENGSDTFHQHITIGTMETNVFTAPAVDKKMISQSPMLTRYLSDGKLKVPFILDLKSVGNIFIEGSSDSTDICENTIAFLHELVQSFLLRQAACRVNLCFFDFNDQCKFNRYAPLRTIYANALFKGIIRNEKEVSGVIDELEKTMFDIGDQKLSENGVDDIFEFNEKSQENPQSMHLLVLLDFPEKYSIDAITQIEKIVANGNAKGIYTIIVKNSCPANFGSKQNNYEAALRSIESHSTKMFEKNGEYYLSSGEVFVPSTRLPANDFSFKVLPVLKSNAEQQKQTVIPMAPMFAVPREYSLINGVANDYSKLIQIPIGKNGGELQSIKFSSTGDNSAHALVIGGTGSGKSNLLHAIILSACYRYSPEELTIYLIDFKGGVEFKYYEANKVVERQLPHIALTGLTSEPEDGVAILTNIRTMLRGRENLFRRNNVEDIVQYNEKYGHDNKLPRILVIIDEVQELFSNERLSQQALVILGEIFKKGRAFGISILWASQTVPKGTGGDFKDKVLSQIGNRICLKLNNADDAEAIGFAPAKVKALNRPEKGLGIIYDGMDYVEFRVAYAENSERRHALVDQINEKWAPSFAGKKRQELFIVGNDEIPQADRGAEKYHEDKKLDVIPKSNDCYYLSIGQDYISGEPFELAVSLRGTKENIWIAGKDPSALRHVMGYALLSTIIENQTNSDFSGSSEKRIYYFNGEIANQNKNALYNVLPESFADQVSVLKSNEELIKEMIALCKLRRERFARVAQTHTPIFVFVHKLQILAEMFTDPKTYSVSEEENEGELKSPVASTGGFRGPSTLSLSLSSSTMNGDKLTFRDIMTELIARGADVGIHFVFSLNDPCAIPELRNEMKNASYKIVLAGVPGDSVGQMTDSYLLRDKVPTKEGVAFCYRSDEMAKFKFYQYSPDTDSKWLSGLIEKYNV